MHPDRKIGIAMGILLVGVVAALFFRSEPLPVDDSLSARRENELNDRLRDRDVAVYLDSDTDSVSGDEGEYAWTLPDVLGSNRAEHRPLPIAVHEDTRSVTPEPSTAELPRFQPPIENSAVAPQIPDRASAQKQVVQQGQEAHGATAVIVKAPAAAQRKKRPDEYREYKVQYGDTLSGISKRFLGSHQSYVEIYEANRDRIEDPNRLKVGTALRIPKRYN